jgi:hypothetical protein
MKEMRQGELNKSSGEETRFKLGGEGRPYWRGDTESEMEIEEEPVAWRQVYHLERWQVLWQQRVYSGEEIAEAWKVSKGVRPEHM